MPVLRGLPKRHTDHMEQFQEAAVRAIAAAAGCSVSTIPVDDGIDLHVRYRAPGGNTASLDVSLKAVSSGWNASRTLIKASLSRQRYDEMRAVGTMLPQIMVIMDVPADPSTWLLSRHPYTALRHVAYWVSLEGEPENAAKSISVSAPAENIFDDEALCRIMARISGGGRP